MSTRVYVFRQYLIQLLKNANNYLFFRIINETQDEEISQHSSDSVEYDDDDYQQEVPEKSNIQTKYHDSKLKIKQLDRISSALRKQNNRQRKTIKSLKANLTDLKAKLHASNQSLASLLKDPAFVVDFSDSC